MATDALQQEIDDLLGDAPKTAAPTAKPKPKKATDVENYSTLDPANQINLVTSQPDDPVLTPSGRPATPTWGEIFADFNKMGGSGAKAESKPVGKQELLRNLMQEQFDAMKGKNNSEYKPGVNPQAAVIGSLATGIGSAAIGGMGELYALGTGASPEEAAQFNRDYQQQHTYQPEAGTRAAEAVNTMTRIGNPINLPGHVISKGVELLDNAGFPATAATVEGLAGVVPAVALPLEGARSAMPKRVEPLGEPVPGSLRDAGAAATDIANEAAAEGASPELLAKIRNAHPDADLPAIRNHVIANTLPVPGILTPGQAARSPTLLTKEFNSGDLMDTHNAQLKTLVANREAIREAATPDIFDTDPVEKGQHLIDLYKAADEPVKADVNAKYDKLRSEYSALTGQGDAFPVDFSKLKENIDASLKRDLKIGYLPGRIITNIDHAATTGGDFHTFEKLRTLIGKEYAAAKRAGNGNEAEAIKTAMRELDNLPLVDSAAELKPLADEARAAAAERFRRIESDPAYSAAIYGKVAPDDFAKKYVLNAKLEGTEKMLEHLGDIPEAQQLIGSVWLDYLDKASGKLGDNEKFLQHGFSKGMEQMGARGKAIFPPDTLSQLEKLREYGRLTQEMPAAAQPNRSGTAIEMKKWLEDMTMSAATAKMGGLPVLKNLKQAFEDRKRAEFVKQSTEVGAGIKQKGEKK